MDLKKIVREIPDFPSEGILFRDITTVLKDADALHEAIELMAKDLEGIDFDCVAGPESRGFIFGMPVAYKLNKGFVPVRKKGKLPAETASKEYDLEYGTATIEIHKDAVTKGKRFVIIDDLCATGGTAKAVAELIESLGGEVVKFEFFIELESLKGRALLCDYEVGSVLKY